MVSSRSALAIAAAAVVCALTACNEAEAPTPPEASSSLPRLPDGQPDFQGIWRRSVMNNSIEDHPGDQFSRKQASLIVDPPDGRIPYQPWAARQKQTNKDKHIDPNGLCLPVGAARTWTNSPITQILQPAGHVVFLLEEAHAYRIIPLDDRPRPPQHVKLWMGESRGRWEGDTLVVEVTNSNGKTWFDVAGNFASDAVHVLERYTMVDADTLRYEATITDPNVFTRPWKLATTVRREKQPGFQMLEEACVEGERDGPVLYKLGYRMFHGAARPGQ
jgi:hypothetical protein